MNFGYKSKVSKIPLEKRVYLLRELNRAENAYRKINREIDVSKEIRKLKRMRKKLFPDIWNKPLYELEEMPFPIQKRLRLYEDKTGKTLTPETFSEMTPEQFLEMRKMVKGLGNKSMRYLQDTLAKYGIVIEHSEMLQILGWKKIK